MIRIFLGNLGSGKSASAVRELATDKSGMKTYTNIMTKGLPNVVTIKPSQIISKVPDPKKEGKFTFALNTDFWSKQEKPLNILWDEIHLTANSRMSSTKVNLILGRFIAMGRRITGFDKRGYGSLTFVAQKERTIDVNIKDLCNEIIYHIGHWIVKCNYCHKKISRSSETPQLKQCMFCTSWDIEKEGMWIERYRFDTLEKYFEWTIYKNKVYNMRNVIQDISEYFRYYDTMQMENVWEDYINT